MSLRARLLSLAVRRVIRSRMRGTIDIAGMRRLLERGAAPMPPGVSCTAAETGGIAGERMRAPGASRRRLFYIHGGGFVCCSPRTHRAITGAFAQRGFDVFAVDYRLAPEHPFPAALDDVIAAWRAFASAGPAVIAGDSAGANLALSVMLQAREAGGAMPSAAVLLSPPTDLRGTGASLRTNARADPMFEIEGLQQFADHYLGDVDRAQPLVSPLNADLAGLPPLCIHVGATEMLLDDSTRLAAKARAAGVPVSLRVFPHVPHVWQWADRFLPEARHSLDEASAFLHHHAERPR